MLGLREGFFQFSGHCRVLVPVGSQIAIVRESALGEYNVE